MTVYLLHFAQPIAPGRHTAQHYLGFTDDLEQRLADHRAGRGARLTEVAKERGIPFYVVGLWPGGRDVESALKRQHNGRRLCPICNRPHDAGQPGLFDDLSFSLADVAEMEF